MTHLLSSQYLFNRNLGPFQSELAWYFIGLVLVGMAGALVFRIMTKKKDIFWQKSAKKLFSCVWTTGMVAIILWVFRQISVLYLSAPILLLLLLVCSLVWLLFVFWYMFVTAPRRRRQLMQEGAKKSYIP